MHVPYVVCLQSRELERVLPVLPNLLSEGLSETRAAAKQIIIGLASEARTQPAEVERLERLLRKHLSEPAYRKIREAIDTAIASSNTWPVCGGRPTEAIEARRSAISSFMLWIVSCRRDMRSRSRAW